MASLSSGSVAYDSVCSYGGRFDEMLLPDELSHLNLTFLADTLERYFGGCAGNIAWAMKAAGGSPRLLAMLGKDGAAYRDHLDKAGIDSRFVKDAPDEWTAQAFITTDSLGNQLTTFHAGAMDLLQVPDCEALSGVSAAHIAPGGLRSMASQGELYRKLGIPYVFDPGQATSQLSPAALTELSLGSMLICVSEYEEKLLADRTGLDRKKLVTPSRSLLVTRGGEGSVIYTEEREIRIPAVQPLRIADPVGAGDAYRGGLLRGLELGLPLETCGRIGSTIASFKLEAPGGQAYSPSLSDIAARYQMVWGTPYPG